MSESAWRAAAPCPTQRIRLHAQVAVEAAAVLPATLAAAKQRKPPQKPSKDRNHGPRPLSPQGTRPYTHTLGPFRVPGATRSTQPPAPPEALRPAAIRSDRTRTGREPEKGGTGACLSEGEERGALGGEEVLLEAGLGLRLPANQPPLDQS